MKWLTLCRQSSIWQRQVDFVHPGAWAELAVAGLLFALLTVAVQGFQFGIDNNIFHIPIVLRLYDLPQFADDAFYQSLHHYVSGVWPLVRFIADESNLPEVFFGFHLAAYVATFCALTWLFVRLGANAVWQLLLLLLIASLSPILWGVTKLGIADLLMGYFTHSELVHFFLLVAFGATLFNHPILAFVCVGLLFNVNAFVAVWVGFVVLFAFLAKAWRENGRALHALRRLLWPLCFGVILALPTALWTFSAIAEMEPPPTGFDFRVFLREYFPRHVLIDVAKAKGLLELVCKLAVIGTGLGILRAQRLLPQAQQEALLGLILGAILLFTIGVVVPYLTASPFILNLHLLRSDLLIHWLAVILAIFPVLVRIPRVPSMGSDQRVLAVQGLGLALGLWPLIAATSLAQWRPVWLRTALRSIPVTMLVLAVLSALLVMTYGRPDPAQGLTSMASALFLIFAGLLLAINSMVDNPNKVLFYWLIAACSMIFGVGLLLAGAGIHTSFIASNSVLFAVVGSGFLIALVAQIGILRDSLVLLLVIGVVPVILLAIGIIAEDKEAPRLAAWYSLATWARNHLGTGPVLVPLSSPADFQWLARRPVWVNWKQCAAVMWSPGFYSQWRTRYFEVKQLQSTDDKLLYANAHNIPFVVTERDNKLECEANQVIYSNSFYCLYSVTDFSASGW